MGKEKAWAAGMSAAALKVLSYALLAIPWVAQMPEDVRSALDSLVSGLLLLGVVYWVPNSVRVAKDEPRPVALDVTPT